MSHRSDDADNPSTEHGSAPEDDSSSRVDDLGVGDSCEDDLGVGDLGVMLAEEIDALLQTEPADERLMALGTDLLQLRSVVDGLQMKVAAELDIRAACVHHTGLKTTGWFARNGNMSRTEAKHRVQTATKLQRIMPNVIDAVSDGRLSFEHAKILAQATNPRIEDEMAQASEFFINAAQSQGVDAWRRDVQAFSELVDQDGGYDPNRDIERNRLRLRSSGSSLKISGELHGELCEIAKQTLNSFADEMFRKFRNDNEIEPSIEVPPRSTLLALGLVELCRRGSAVSLVNSGASKPEVTVVVQAHDATKVHSPEGVELFQEKLPRKVKNYGPSPELLKELSKYAWFDPEIFGYGDSDRRNVGDAYGRDGPAQSTDQRTKIEHYLMCDPVLRPIVVDSLGAPLDAGRDTRLATNTQRHALSVRDYGCIWPGCDDPPNWCDAHHVVPWQHGGNTDLANLASLCRHHHTVTHLPGWAMYVDEDTGEFAWTTPSGQTLHAERNQPADVAGLAKDILKRTGKQGNGDTGDNSDSSPGGPSSGDALSGDRASGDTASGDASSDKPDAA